MYKILFYTSKNVIKLINIIDLICSLRYILFFFCSCEINNGNTAYYNDDVTIFVCPINSENASHILTESYLNQ